MIYSVLLHVSDKDLSTVLAVIKEAGTLVSVTATTKEEKQSRYVNGTRNKGISGEKLLLKILSDAKRDMNIKEIQKAFEADGFSGNSVSPTATRLIRGGKILRRSNGNFAIAK